MKVEFRKTFEKDLRKCRDKVLLSKIKTINSLLSTLRL